MHGSGEAERFYRELEGPALIGMEATGNSRWFERLVEKRGHDPVDWGCGQDSGQLCSQAEDR